MNAIVAASWKKQTRLLLIWGLAIVLLIGYALLDSSYLVADPHERSSISPSTAIVGTYGTWHVIYNVGADGMSQGGGIKTQLPNGWHFYRPPQTDHPERANYVSARASRAGVSLHTTIESREGLDGQSDRHDWVVAITVDSQDLLPGDAITVTYGDMSGGGTGIRAPVTTGIDEVLVASDTSGDGTYELLDDRPGIIVESQPASRLSVIVPSQVQADQPFTVDVAAADKYWNQVRSFTGTVHFFCSDPQAVLPSGYTFRGSTDAGYRQFTATLHTPGTHVITITESQLAPEGISSNPTVLFQELPQLHLYWGDLHSHSEFSFDGAGNPERAFEQAQHVRGLDFYALTDHDGTNSVSGLTPWEWDRILELVGVYHAPESFVVFPAFEWTCGPPHGHHNVLFMDPQDAAVFHFRGANALTALWAALANGRALSIPHHTGIRWHVGPGYLNWYSQDDLLRPIAEIYSHHGSSEYYGNSMAYEVFQPLEQSQPGPHYLRDAWESGLHLGVIASTDEHTAHPGLPHYGLAAVYAEELTREAIFDAILRRHTYATTGERLVLDFRIDDHFMGDKYRAVGQPEIEVAVVGTDELEFVTVIKYDGLDWTRVYSLSSPLSRQVSFSYTDTTFSGDSLYYVRVRQTNEVEGRPVMAWSSPIWVYTSCPVTISPSTKVAHRGVPFTIAVGIDVAHNLGGFLFDLVYDPSSLQVGDVSLGPFLGSTGRAVFSTGLAIDNVTGRTRYGASSGGTQPGPDGAGTLALVTMMAQVTGTTSLALEQVQLWDTSGSTQTAQVAEVEAARVVVQDPIHTYLPLVLRSH
jgi:hypothetical protein